MITYRPAFPDELARAASLCESSSTLPGDGITQCFLAVKSRPVERIVGAAFWRQRDTHAAFEWAMVAAMQDTSAESDFLAALAAEIDFPSLQTTVWLEPHSPAAVILAAAGFHEIMLRETFSAKTSVWRKLIESHVAHAFQVSPLTLEHAPAVIKLLRGSAFSENELNHGFATASQEDPSLFDFPSSAILLQEGRICGVCLALANPNQTHLCITAFAIDVPEIFSNAALSAILYHALAAPSLKELFIQRLSIPTSLTSQPALDSLLANYFNTPTTEELLYGKSKAVISQC